MTTSQWSELVRQRFASQRVSHSGDPVPWHLDDKAAAYEWARSLGFRVPKTAVTSTLTEALETDIAASGGFVLKRPNTHSGRGTYVIGTTEDDRLFESLRLEPLNVDDLTALDASTPEWLVEERLDSGIAGAEIPYDYKAYCFRGEVMMVFQIDRNVTPPRLAIFDGAFIPLTPEQDYTVDPARGGYAGHVLPRHAEGLLSLARQVARSLDTAFVRVDLYDTPTGPVLGELTFAPGGVHAGMITLSDDVHTHLDAALNDSNSAFALSGFDIDLEEFRRRLGQVPTLVGNDGELRRMHQGAARRDRRYAHRALQSLNKKSTLWHVFELALRAIAVSNGDRKYAAHIALGLGNPRAPISGKGRQGEYLEIGTVYHERRRTQSDWDAFRYAQLMHAHAGSQGLVVMQELANRGVGSAKEYLNSLNLS